MGRMLCQVVALLSGRAIGRGQISRGLGSILDLGGESRSSLIPRTVDYVSEISRVTGEDSLLRE